MKKIYIILLAAAMMILFTACGSKNDNSAVSAPQVISSAANEDPVDVSSKTEPSAPSTTESIPSVTESDLPGRQSDVTSSESPAQPQPAPEAKRVLVAYFSATNTTKGVAETIADRLDADLYEITPAVPYTSADLDYHDDGSRSTIEMNDPNARPAISGSVNNMEQYDIVFIGYPIWWGEAPRILSTFAESYSFSGKTVVPFCTSGSSGVGSSASNLEKLADGGTWLPGTRLSGGASRDSVADWINGLGLGVTAG